MKLTLDTIATDMVFVNLIVGTLLIIFCVIIREGLRRSGPEFRGFYLWLFVCISISILCGGTLAFGWSRVPGLLSFTVYAAILGRVLLSELKIKPTVLADFILEFVAGAKAAEVIMADLKEMRPGRNKKYGKAGAQWWYVGQILRAIIAYVPTLLKSVTGWSAVLAAVQRMKP